MRLNGDCVDCRGEEFVDDGLLPNSQSSLGRLGTLKLLLVEGVEGADALGIRLGAGLRPGKGTMDGLHGG